MMVVKFRQTVCVPYHALAVLSTINLVQSDQPLRVQKIVLYPYPDLARLWFRLQLVALQQEPPNIDVHILNPDGTHNSSLAFVAYDDTFVDATIHMKTFQATALYVCTTTITTGMPPDVVVHDTAHFEFPLVFRDAAVGEEGFGYDLSLSA